MIGPRDSIVRIFMGEDVSLDELLCDHSDFVDSDEWYRSLAAGRLYELPPEFWTDKVHDFVGEY